VPTRGETQDKGRSRTTTRAAPIFKGDLFLTSRFGPQELC
jgi:hypothetical protein